MTPLQRSINDTINAQDEGRVSALLYLYEMDLLHPNLYTTHKKKDLEDILIKLFKMPPETVEYWLSHFHFD